MSSAAYEYQSDNGTTYQIFLDSTFASVLGYVLATGSEPYLPQAISPRYCTYKNNTLGIYATVVVTAGFRNSFPPPTVIVSGVTYTLNSLYGEAFGATAGANLFVIAGQQGATGATGATGPTGPGFGAVGQVQATGNTSFSNSATALLSSGTLPVGEYFVSINCTFTAASATVFGLGLHLGSTYIAAAQSEIATASGYTTVGITALANITTAGPLTLYGQSGTTTAVTMEEFSSIFGSTGPASSMAWILYT